MRSEKDGIGLLAKLEYVYEAFHYIRFFTVYNRTCQRIPQSILAFFPMPI